ncbi:MAG: MarR family transcriptional regulator [Pseudomonadota bacterium]
MDLDDQRARLFELFNEIHIIQQLATTEFNRRLPEGLHVSHFAVINHLCRLGDGRTPLQLASAFQVTKPTMTHTLTQLGTRGFVDVRANPADGRSKLVYITAAGRAFRETAIASLNPTLDAMADDLDLPALLSLLPQLATLRRYLDTARDVGP